MARPLRIQYENAFYHVMNRGANHQETFKSVAHYRIFLDLLGDVSSIYNANIHAYCLMSNHYHLLISTPRANLASIMRHIDSIYTRRFNHIQNRDGSLFRGRYKAVLIEADGYLLQVCRYIHLNPVKAGIARNPQDYRWSSYKDYLNCRNKPTWLKTALTFSMLNKKLSNFNDFMNQSLDITTELFYSKKRHPTILGSDAFKNRLLEDIEEGQISESVGDLKRTKPRPTINEIIQTVAYYYHLDTNNLTLSSRGTKNLARHMAILICRKTGGYSLKKIAEHIQCITPRALSSVVCKMNKRIMTDNTLKQDYQKLIRLIH